MSLASELDKLRSWSNKKSDCEEKAKLYRRDKLTNTLGVQRQSKEGEGQYYVHSIEEACLA